MRDDDTESKREFRSEEDAHELVKELHGMFEDPQGTIHLVREVLEKLHQLEATRVVISSFDTSITFFKGNAIAYEKKGFRLQQISDAQKRLGIMSGIHPEDASPKRAGRMTLPIQERKYRFDAVSEWTDAKVDFTLTVTDPPMEKPSAE